MTEEFATQEENPAAEFVRKRRHDSPIHRYVADHGLAKSRNDIEHACLDGRDVALSRDITDDERKLVTEAIQATEPEMKLCFANAIQLWEYDHRFAYAEGFAIPPGFDVAIEHAWCFLDGRKLVDVTAPFADYFGAVITDEDTLARYTKNGEIGYGVIRNHHDRYRFLRERGYADGER